MPLPEGISESTRAGSAGSAPGSESSESTDVLRIEELSRRYGKRWALDGVSFTVRRGDIFGFLGPNGAGKTTTIRIVMGLIRATSGRVHLFGEPRRGAALAAMARIGAMVEIPHFWDHLSGRRNLRALGALSGMNGDVEIDRILEIVRLRDAADDAVRTYSQGMRQRLGIAQALLADPDFVILDEPTNGLDPHGVHEMRQVILDLARERSITFLISSHQLLEIEQLSNRVAILRKGRLLISGAVGEILAAEVTRHRLVVGDPKIAIATLDGTTCAHAAGNVLEIEATVGEIPEIIGRLAAAGAGVREVVPHRPTLEDYFLRVTKDQGVDLGR